jgi:hypothetical protein
VSLKFVKSNFVMHTPTFGTLDALLGGVSGLVIGEVLGMVGCCFGLLSVFSCLGGDGLVTDGCLSPLDDCGLWSIWLVAEGFLRADVGCFNGVGLVSDGCLRPLERGFPIAEGALMDESVEVV